MANILVVEDDHDVVELLGEYFQEELGAQTMAVTSLEELVSCSTAALECDVAILDLHLGAFGPAPEGLAALRWLRERGYQREVVITTGNVTSIANAASLGPIRVVPKPYEFPVLLKLVQDVLSKAA